MPWLGSLVRENGGRFEPAEQLQHPVSGRLVRTSQAWWYEPATQTATCQTTWEHVGDDGQVVERWQSQPRPLHAVFRFEVEHLLARVGLAVEALYGDFFRQPLADGSEQMIWVTRSRT